MSAICGAIRLDGRPVSAHDLAGVMAALEPLGPDGTGTWEGRAGPLGVALGAAVRRRRTDDQQQPLFDHRRSLVLVGDVRTEEHPLAEYERAGEGMLERLTGSFAFALVDLRRGGVLLARDRLGEQPLVVHERKGVVAFASTALALASFEGIGRRLDMRRAAELLALAYHSERTLVEGARWLPPGGAMWVGANGVRRWSWWRPDMHAPRDDEPPEHYAAELRAALDRAVESAARRPGRVGAMTSGGLDSSSVAATAARMLAPEPLPTYTSAPPPGWSGPSPAGWDADETPLVRDLAALHPNMEPRFVHVEPGTSLLAGRERLWRLGAGPERNPDSSLWLDALIERAAADGVTTLLGGNRGNSFFSANGPDWLVELLHARRLRAFARELLAWSRANGSPLHAVLRRNLLARRRSPRPDAVREWLAYTALRPEQAAELDLPALLPQLDVRRARTARELAPQASLILGAQSELALAREMLSGVELCDPTGDRRVIDAALRQPEWVRRRGGAGRAVARAAMADRLPASIAQRRRRGQQLPDWLDLMSAARAELAEEVEAAAQHGPSRELIDVERLRRLLAAWPAAARAAEPAVERDYRYALFRALCVSRYLRWFERA